MKKALIAVTLCLAGAIATAGEPPPMPMNSVQGMIRALEQDGPSGWEAIHYGYALGYIRGVDDGMFVTMKCYQGLTSETNGQLARMWINIANEFPEMWNKPGAVRLITSAMLIRHFPCEGGESVSPTEFH